MRLWAPRTSEAIAGALLASREWYRYWRELGVSLFEHNHDGTDSATVDHTDLSSVGVNTHPQIDKELRHLESTIEERVMCLERRVAMLESLMGYSSQEVGDPSCLT